MFAPYFSVPLYRQNKTQKNHAEDKDAPRAVCPITDNRIAHNLPCRVNNRRRFLPHTYCRSSNKKTQSGIGLENVKKRLELYYGNNYSFEAKQEDDKYVVIIKIGDKYNEKKV